MTTTHMNGNGATYSNGSATANATASTHAIEILSQIDRDEIMTLIAQMRDKLPFLQDITAEQRQTMLGMGNKNRAFVGQVLEVTTQNSDFLPRSFNVEQLRTDIATFDRLSSILMSLTQLRNLVDATTIAIGTQAYEQSLVAYRHAKVSGHGASLESMMAEMGQHFAKKSRKKEGVVAESSQPVVGTGLAG